MRPRRPKQYCLQLVIYIYIYIYPRHQHCTDEAQKAETVLSAVSYIYIYRVAYKLERKTKLLEGPGNLIKTFRPFGLRQLKFF